MDVCLHKPSNNFGAPNHVLCRVDAAEEPWTRCPSPALDRLGCPTGGGHLKEWTTTASVWTAGVLYAPRREEVTHC
jgi:hypothetical protein